MIESDAVKDTEILWNVELGFHDFSWHTVMDKLKVEEEPARVEADKKIESILNKAKKRFAN